MKDFSLNSKHLFLTVPDAGSVRSGRQEGWVLDDSSLSGLQMAAFLLCTSLVYLFPLVFWEIISILHCIDLGFLGGLVVKIPPANTEDSGSIPRSERSPGEENDNLLQYSCLGNLMDKDAWWAAVQEITKELDTT